MEGGIAFFLLLVIAVVAIVVGVALYVTGGSLWAKGSQNEGDVGQRPTHKAPTSPTQEHTHFVGTPSGDAAARRSADAD